MSAAGRSVQEHDTVGPPVAAGAAASGPPRPPRRRQRWDRRRRRQALWGYLFLAPWFVGLVGLTAGPMIASLYLSFTDFDLFSSPEWVGLDNYAYMFADDRRWRSSVVATAIYVGLSVPLKLVVALAVAMALNAGLRALGLYRAVFYLPSLLGSSVAIAILWQRVFDGNGIFNRFLGLFGIEGQSWISQPSTALYTLVILAIWQFGSPMVIFLAGLKQVPVELYEAARVDGSGAWQRFRYVTVPLITPLIFFNLVLQMITAFQNFTPAFIVSGGSGGPADSTLLYALYLYQEGFSNFRMGYASALAWFLLVVIAAFTAANFFFSRYWVHYDDADAKART